MYAFVDTSEDESCLLLGSFYPICCAPTDFLNFTLPLSIKSLAIFYQSDESTVLESFL